jgi:hypothetical protein
MHIVYSDEYSGFTKKAIVTYAVKTKDGAIACATEEIYKNIQNFYLKNDLKSIQSQINNKNCMLLNNGEKLEAYEGICDIADKNSVKLFKSKKVFLQKIYVPCFAVEMEGIIKDSQGDLREKGLKQDLSKEKIQEKLDNKIAEPENNDKQNIDLPNKIR